MGDFYSLVLRDLCMCRKFGAIVTKCLWSGLKVGFMILKRLVCLDSRSFGGSNVIRLALRVTMATLISTDTFLCKDLSTR